MHKINMKNQYRIIGILAIILLVFIGAYLFITRDTDSPLIDNRGTVPSVVVTYGKPLPTGGDIGVGAPDREQDYRFLNYQYPIRFESLTIDYISSTRTMKVYFRGEYNEAARSLKRFFAQFGFEDPIQTNLQIYFIGDAK